MPGLLPRADGYFSVSGRERFERLTGGGGFTLLYRWKAQVGDKHPNLKQRFVVVLL